jgi:putative ABC transport system ATP-binding protein
MSAAARFVEVEAAHLRYGDAETGTYALRGVSVRASAGELLMIRGPSGSGKTTLLQLMGALKTPDSGRVSLCGDSTHGLSQAALRALRLRRIGFIFQFFNLFPTLSACENVAVPLDLYGVSGADAKARARALLEELGLGARADARPGQLSGGQRQRVAVARALVNDPDVILADEPTAALDGENGAIVVAALRRLAHEKDRVVVIVSHDQRLEDKVDRMVTIEDGLVVAQRRPDMRA